MNQKDLIYSEIEQQKLILNENEVSSRLNTIKGYTNELILKCEKVLRQEINCKYSAVKVNVSFSQENQVNLGFGEIYSKNLYKNLFGCNNAYIFSVTLGIDVDRLLKKLAVTSVSEHFITDGLSSAFAESACEFVDKELRKNKKCRPRFSPGYGDLPLDIQPKILELTNADKLLNITLSSSLLMTPTKSITAIMGIEND